MAARPVLIVTYLDSSSLLRLCLGEGDLALVEQAMARVPTTSVLAAVEVPGAIAARYHRRMIDEGQRDRLLLVADTALGGTAQIGLTAAIRREAVSIGARFLVRALDAIHLGTAVVVQRQQRHRGGVLRFCTADRRQSEVASELFGEEQVDLVPPLS